MIATFFACLAAVVVARALELALGYWLAVRRQRRMRELLASVVALGGSGLIEYVPPATPSEPTEMN
jgi:hypothetical protein